MRKRFVAVFLTLLAASLRADVWTRAIEIKNDGAIASIAQLRDGTILLIKEAAAAPCIARVAATAIETTCYGIPLKQSGSGRVAIAADCGFYVYGSNYEQNVQMQSGFVYRFDAAGKVCWARRFRFSDSVRIAAAAASADGGLFVAGGIGTVECCGRTYAASSIVMKLDATGEILWQRTFDTSGAEFVTDILATNDGAIASVMSESGSWLYKLSNSGQELWSVAVRSKINSIALLKNGDIAAAGWLPVSKARDIAWIGRFDGRGHLGWQRAGTQDGALWAIAVDGRDHLIAFRGLEQTGAEDAIGFVTFALDGSVVSQFAIGFPERYHASQTAFANDGGLLLVSDFGNHRLALHKTDNETNVSKCLARAPLTEAFRTLATEAFTAQPVDRGEGHVVSAVIDTQQTRVESTIADSCGTTAAAKVPTGAGSQTETVPGAEANEERAFETEVNRLIAANNFAELDRLAKQVTDSRAKFANGLFKAPVFYQTVAAENDERIGEAERLTFMNEWMRREPSSPVAAIAAAVTYLNFAWRARGTSAGYAVGESASQKFARYLNRAHEILESAKGIATGDVQYDVARARVAGPFSCEELMTLAYDQSIASRHYFPTFAVTSYYLLPRWCGSPSEHRRFVEFASAAMPPEERDKTYGELALRALEIEENAPMSVAGKAKFFSEYGYDWNRMKRGLMQTVKEHTKDQHELQRIAWAAWKADDRALARELFARPDAAWSDAAKDVWKGTEYYNRARDWALKAPADTASATATSAILLRNDLRLTDGREVKGFNSFLVDTGNGVVAISAVNLLDTPQQYSTTTIYNPIHVAELRALLSSWTMFAPSAPQRVVSVASVQPRTIGDERGTSLRGVVLTLKPAQPPVHALKPRMTPIVRHERAHVIGCRTSGSTCTEAAYVVELHGTQAYTPDGHGIAPLEFRDDVDWHDFIGSPVIDEDGLAIGVISQPYPGAGGGMPEKRNRASAEEVAFLLQNVKK